MTNLSESKQTAGVGPAADYVRDYTILSEDKNGRGNSPRPLDVRMRL